MKISYSLERSLLQGAVALAAAVPVSAGLTAIFGGADLLGLAGHASGDSHVRYLSGLLLGIGLAFWTMIPAIETYTDRFQLLTSVVFVGGCARLFGIAAFGAPALNALTHYQWHVLRHRFPAAQDDHAFEPVFE